MRLTIDEQQQRELINAVRRESTRIGMDPQTMLTIMAYETGGTLDPWQRGPKTQWGVHRGLIQMGGPQRKEYGYEKDSSISDQVRASADYFLDRGWRKGMSELDAYSIVNAGAPGLHHRTDANNGGAPGTVADKVASRDWKSYKDRVSQVFDQFPEESSITEYVDAVEAAGRVLPLPVDTSLKGLFDTPALPGVDGNTPTEREGIPIARRDNPANPTFSDNSVGRLQNKDYGYQTARTVNDLMGVLGGPEQPGLFASGSGQAIGGAPQQTAGNATVKMPSAFEGFASVQPTASEDLALGTQPEANDVMLLGSGPSQRLGPRQIAEEPSVGVAGDFDDTWGLFNSENSAVSTDHRSPSPETYVPAESVPGAHASILQPLPPPQQVPSRKVAAPFEPTLDLVPNASQEVAENVRSHGLFGDAGDGFSYGYSPWGSGVSKVHDSADEQTKIAASGSGLFGAFNNEFGTNLGIGPGKMFAPLATVAGTGAAMAGLGPFALAIPAANALGGGKWLTDRLDAVPRAQRQVSQPRRPNNFLAGLFGGNPLQSFRGGLFSAPREPAGAVGGLFGGSDGPSAAVSFNGPIGRNETSMNPANLSPAARDEIAQATRGLF
ncbi:hypothetical protein [uncultured Roseibium sp.]|uniref:hypothetical protein n=1 Tax=uncultured Roseibium sp. TaxID=1936171 RepID=UPI00260295B4|nr:hypothetical protein [uncultured Roseibium sp.]